MITPAPTTPAVAEAETTILASRCRHAREQAGLSLHQARRVIPGLDIDLVEQGGGPVSDFRLQQLADTYGVSLAWLRDGTTTPLAPDTAEALRGADISTSDRASIAGLLGRASPSPARPTR